jgi:hypothetical protein
LAGTARGSRLLHRRSAARRWAGLTGAARRLVARGDEVIVAGAERRKAVIGCFSRYFT